MQKPLFKRQYTNPIPRSSNATARRSCGRGIPVQRPPKVISVPVRRVHKISKSTAAKRIQKAFRGFLVRRNVNKIAGIKKQVDEMEAELSLEETVDLIRKDDKERLKVNETLMSLLLKLDSVRSFDSGVRDFRKSVIKKVIVLQERLDAIISKGEDLNRETDEVAKEDAVGGDGTTVEIKHPIEQTDNQIDPNCGKRLEGEDEKEESCGVAEQDEAQKEETVADEGMEMEQQQPDLIQGKCEEKGGGGDERKLEAMERMMGRMMEKNDILIGMVRELCEKNKVQTEMFNSLSKRVDSLEKSFKRSKSKKTKQTKAGAGSDVDNDKNL